MNILNKTISGFTIKYMIGSGGMANVYYAENKLGKKAAIKVLKSELCAIDSLKERFEQEAKIMVDIEHKHIRQAYDLEQVSGQPAIIMEYLEGNTLKQLIDKGKIANEKAQKYFEQCASALRVTHSKEIVHRDIKPSNIFITKDDEVKIMDFGIAKVKESSLGTMTNQMLGTPVYMSPEQIKSPKNVATKSDVYSLAVTFYHALTGKVPYDCNSYSDFEILSKIVHDDLDLSNVPSSWSALFSEMLIKDAAYRISMNSIWLKICNAAWTEGTKHDLKAPSSKLQIRPNQNPVMISKPMKFYLLLNLLVFLIATIMSMRSCDSGAVLANHVSSAISNMNGNAEDAAEEIATTMVKISDGTFIMGCPNEQENDCDNDEKPSHLVKVSGFMINKYEVTQEQWRAIMGNNPSYFNNCKRCPVESVSWNDIDEFIIKLYNISGVRYRLPTEAEYEYAARGGKSFKYSGSNDVSRVAWYSINNGSKTHPVGQKAPNDYGLYDMNGNVWEWCSNWFHGYPGSLNVTDRSGSLRVDRGGGWNNNERDCRVSYRRGNSPTDYAYDLGFRLALSF